MSEVTACVVVGPSGDAPGRAHHLSVMGQRLVGDRVCWVFTSIPIDLQALVTTFRLTAQGASEADVVRVGAALALYGEPDIGEILDRVGSEDTYDVAVTPEVARLAAPITSWALPAVVTAGPELRHVAADLALGEWAVRFAELDGAVVDRTRPRAPEEG